MAFFGPLPLLDVLACGKPPLPDGNALANLSAASTTRSSR
jgi:hypothetical protein